MNKLLTAIRKNYFDNTVELSKLSKTFFLWSIGLVLVYVTNIYLIRLIGLDSYGRYTVFISWVSLASMLLTFGWDGYLVQKIPQLLNSKEGRSTGKYLLRKAITTFLGLYTGLFIILVIVINYTKNFNTIFESRQLYLFLLLIFLFSAIALAKAFLKIFHVVTKIQWLEEVLKPLVLFAVILCYYGYAISLTLTDLYLVNLFVFGALALCLLIIASRVYKLNFKEAESAAVTEKWAGKCLYFMCIYLGYSIFSRMELLFLGYFAKNEEAAKYQILLRISDLVLIPDFLFNYFLPQKFSYAFAHNKIADARTLFRNASRTILLLQLICLGGLLIVGYWYLQSFNIASAHNYLLLLVMCTAPVFYSLFGSSNLVLKTSGNERYAFYALMIVLLLEGAANYMFILPYGLKAAVIISWGGVLLYTLLLSVFLYRKLNFSNWLTGFLFGAKGNSK